MPSTPLGTGDFGEQVAGLHAALLDAGYPVTAQEQKRQFFGPTTRAAVSQFQREHRLPVTGTLTPETAAALSVSAPARAPAAANASSVAPSRSPSNPVERAIYAVTGTVSSAPTSIVGGLTVEVVDKNVGDDVVLADGTTDSAGHFEVRAHLPANYLTEHRKSAPDLQVDVLYEGVVVASSIVRYNASTSQQLDVQVPAGQLPTCSEYEMLTTAVGEVYRGPMIELRHNETRQDITYLTAKTNLPLDEVQPLVDAARFARAAADTGVTIPMEVFYGLLRTTSAPCTWEQLRRAGTDTVAADLRNAIDTGAVGEVVVGADTARLADAVVHAATQIRQRQLEQAAPLAQPALRYEATENVRNPVIDMSLDQALAAQVQTAVGTVSPELQLAMNTVLATLHWRDAISQQPTKGQASPPQSPTVGAVAADALRRAATLDPSTEEEVADLTQNVATRSGRSLAEALHLDAPLRDNPLLHSEVEMATIVGLAGLAGLSESATMAAADATTGLFVGPDHSLAQMVQSQVLTDAQARSMTTLLDLGNLTDHNLPLIQALSDQGTTTPAEMATWDRARFLNLITSTRTPVPPGETAESYAEHIVANLEFTYPTQSLAAQLVQPNDPAATVYANNPALDLRQIDLTASEPEILNSARVPAEAKPEILGALQSHQRLLALADTTADRVALAQAGFDSALAITAHTEAKFTAASGLNKNLAHLVYARAQRLAVGVAHTWGAAKDILHSPWPRMPIANLDPGFIDELRKIAGFDQLFGSQDYCDCGDCQSMLSPAAYFVDLMHFVEQNISTPVFIDTNLPNDPLYLKVRRPDLWTLELSCDNTKTLIPYLQIVDEILEAFLWTILSADPYPVLADPTNRASCQLPFNLPYTELSRYLGYFELTPADIYRVLDRPAADVWRATTGLTADEATIIATPDLAGIHTRLGLRTKGFDVVGVPYFLHRLGLTRDQLTTVLASRFDPDLAAITVTKNKDNSPGEIQNFPEELTNLPPDRADVIFRLTRLLRPLPWSLDELDLVLLTGREAGQIGATLDAGTVSWIGRILTIQHDWNLSVPQLCAVIGLLPVSRYYPSKPPHDSDRLLYEQLFDINALFGYGPLPAGHDREITYYDYALDTTLGANPPTVDPHTPLLLAGLGCSEPDLHLLLNLCKAQISFDPTGHGSLNRAGLSLLYRHALAARALGIDIQDLIGALTLCIAPVDPTLTTLDRVDSIIEFGTWLATAPFSIGQLQLILTGSESAAVKYTNTVDTTKSLVLAVQAVGTGAPNTPPPDPVATLQTQLATAFHASAGRLTDLLLWTGTNLTDPTITAALSAHFTNGVPDQPQLLQPLLDLLHRLERVTLLFGELKTDDAGLHYLTTNATPILGIASPTSPTLADIQSLTAYHEFATRTIAPPAGTTPSPAAAATGTGTDAATLTQTLLTDYTSTKAFNAADRDKLAVLLHGDHRLTDSVITIAQPLPAVPIHALSRVSELLDFCTRLGINGYSLQTLGGDDSFDALTAAASVAFGAIGAQYTDPTARDTALAPYQDSINTAKRDALTNYLINYNFGGLGFTDDNDLYDYFLIDVDMTGCGRTSRVVEATNTIQLYVQRCLTNLEQHQSGSQGNVDPSRVPQDQWEWRKNFRVWQANRKVFLNPESYLEPALRDDKTPVFKDLEDTLLQAQITDATASDGYASYLTALADLAHLRIVGTCYDAPSQTYYFFGRTQQDPPSFYYRTWDTTTWTPWINIDLPIDAPYVSSVVFLGRLYLFWVDITTNDHTTFTAGTSTTDYTEVKVQLVFSVQKPDGKWRPPQRVDWLYPSCSEDPGCSGENDILFQGPGSKPAMDADKEPHKTYPQVVDKNSIVHRYYNSWINPCSSDRLLDLFHNRLIAGGGLKGSDAGYAVGVYYVPLFGIDIAVLGVCWSVDDEPGFDAHREQTIPLGQSSWGYGVGTFIPGPPPYPGSGQFTPNMRYLMHAVHNDFPETVVQLGDQQCLVHTLTPGWKFINCGKTMTYYGSWGLVRLSTSVADRLGEVEADSGLDGLFKMSVQYALKESPLNVYYWDLNTLASPADNPDHIDLEGAFGRYFQELFFHIPWSIARQLNAAGQYADAMRWLNRIFDPTATPDPASDKPLTESNWRYCGLRGVTPQTLHDILTDLNALQAYENDPFNPFAIARLRPVAFQKAIVMQYVDNLLDWGDSLFAQDTMESVNEATMLYVLAAEILGPRPESLGSCETTPESDLTYAQIGSQLTDTSDFLIKLENWVQLGAWERQLRRGAAPLSTKRSETKTASNRVAVASTAQLKAVSTVGSPARPRLLPYASAVGLGDCLQSAVAQAQDVSTVVYHPTIMVKQKTLAFCVPPDDVLLSRWDRVSDRLFKIRNCMNISGVRRQLALFAPPINPSDLVRARAAGLSLEDALGEIDESVPPYRFTTMIERARQAAQTVSSFGGALLSALEKKDAEELLLLRSLHEQTILQMTTDVKTEQLQEAQYQLQSVVESATNIQNRIDYYQGLIDSRLFDSETSEQTNLGVAPGHLTAAQIAHSIASDLYLIPQVGAPTAMTFGGQQLGAVASAFGQFNSDLASIAQSVASAAALNASFDRRAQEWRQQLAQAQQQAKEVEQQCLAASVKATYAQQELTIHQKSIEQAADLDEFYKDKFTGLGLYTYLARTLTTLHRQAYETAYQLAQAAQVAYYFETDDDKQFIAPDNWSSEQVGLLSSERLLLQLQQMENAYLTSNTRRYELTQAFPLSLVDPNALLALRETGSCSFELPEILFDIVYPGFYKRLIKSVRLSIPAVAGPYTNIGAKLTLTASQVRLQPSVDIVPTQGQAPACIQMATSTGVNDSGMFELNFRDERYLPFEGAGAVNSSWTLELPEQLRMFDYQTISDVIVHIGYTACDQGVFRTKVEDSLAGALTAYASTTGLFRILSLRHDFPESWYQLMGDASSMGATAGVGTEFTTTAQHFPYFLATRGLTATSMQLFLVPATEEQGAGPSPAPVDTTGLTVTVDGNATGAWTPDMATGFASTTVSVSGPAAAAWRIAVTGGDLDPAKVGDIVVALKYTVS